MPYSFEDFTLDTARRELRRAGELIPMEPQVFDLLALLVQNHDRVVSLDEIIEEIWHGRVISNSAVASRINAVRRAVNDSGGEQRLIKTYPRKGLRFTGRPDVDIAEPPPSAPAATSVTRKSNIPSIAILPFASIGDDPGRDYFADGMVEEIITALSHFSGLTVMARGSTFNFPSNDTDVGAIGRELGVRYLLNGSIRRDGERVRISGQLIEASSGVHLWAETFEGALSNVFDLQDRVAAHVAGAIVPRLGQAELNRSRRKPTASLDAYDFYLRALAGVHRWSREANSAALEDLERAIHLDPDFAVAYGLAARCYSQRKSCGWMVDRGRETEEAERLSREASERGKEDAAALCMAGIGLAYVAGYLEEGDALIERALAINPNLAWAWVFSSWVRIWLGQAEPAIERGMRAVELSPHDPEVLFYLRTATTYSEFLNGHYLEAMETAQAALRARPDFLISLYAAACCAALGGEADAAMKIMTRVSELDPHTNCRNLSQLFPFKHRRDADRWESGLRQAGLAD